MTDFDDDREAAVAMGETLSAEEREAFADLNGSVRKVKRAALHIDCGSGEMISPAGIFSDKEIARMEQRRRDDVERFAWFFKSKPADG